MEKILRVLPFPPPPTPFLHNKELNYLSKLSDLQGIFVGELHA